MVTRRADDHRHVGALEPTLLEFEVREVVQGGRLDGAKRCQNRIRNTRDASGEPLLLVMGLGVQMLYWPDDFCAALADQGFVVARFVNRDNGLSTHFTAAGVPSLFTMLTRPAAAAVWLTTRCACSTR